MPILEVFTCACVCVCVGGGMLCACMFASVIEVSGVFQSYHNGDKVLNNET